MFSGYSLQVRLADGSGTECPVAVAGSSARGGNCEFNPRVECIALLRLRLRPAWGWKDKQPVWTPVRLQRVVSSLLLRAV